MCLPVLPPPPDVLTDAPPPGDMDGCKADRYAAHTQNSACSGCHLQMDSLGNGLEHYDYLGKYREYEYTYKTEEPVEECPIELEGSYAGQTFLGPKELSNILLQDSTLTDCMIQQLLSFALGQANNPILVQYLADSQPVLSIQETLTNWIADPSFVMRGQIWNYQDAICYEELLE